MNRIVRRGRRVVAKVMQRSRGVLGQFSTPEAPPIIIGSDSLADAETLAGKVAVVTGSTRGIGLAVAQALVSSGARVVINGRSRQSVDAVVKDMRRLGGEAAGVAADVTTSEGIERLRDGAVEAFGRIDILVNRPGVNGVVAHKAWNIPPQELHEAIAVNIAGPFLCTAAFVRWMVENGVRGRVVEICHGAPAEIPDGRGIDSVAGGTHAALSDRMASELGRESVALVRIYAGRVQSDYTRATMRWEDAELLPQADSVVPACMHAITATRDLVHGRALAAWRFRQDKFAEAMLNSPIATARGFKFKPLVRDGKVVDRHAADLAMFDRGESPFGTSPKVRKAITLATGKRPLWRYPDENYGKLRAALAAEHALPPECFVFGNGLSEMISRLVNLFAHPGDEVLANEPGWFGFKIFCGKADVVCRGIPFALSGPDNRPHHNLQKFIDAIGVKTRMIYLISPSNPEGVPLRSDEFREFLEAVPPHLPVVVDEAYIEYASDADVLQSHQVILDTDRIVIGLRTFSKFYGLAALSLGYAIAKPEIVNLISRLGHLFNVSVLSEAGAVAALKDKAFRDDVRQRVTQERSRIQQSLADLGLDYVPSQASFVLAECPCEHEKFFRRFEEEGIYLSRGGFFADKYIGFPIATEEQNTRNLEILRSLV